MQVIKGLLHDYFAGGSQQNPQIIINSTRATIILADRPVADNAANYFQFNQTFMQNLDDELQKQSIQASVKVMAANVVEEGGGSTTGNTTLENNTKKAGHAKYWIWITAIASVLSAIAMFVFGLLMYMHFRRKKKAVKNFVILAKSDLSSKKIAIRRSKMREHRARSLSNSEDGNCVQNEKTIESSGMGSADVSSIESHLTESAFSSNQKQDNKETAPREHQNSATEQDLRNSPVVLTNNLLSTIVQNT
ncbi:hypothetical protein RFI_05504 [Reticulomyxa filosa]|uniref:Uncharacterized protein n=1 Tax=Reticulomyxa filosa TaxID=46433 RepID=X6P0L5_RETFI|nr:hypothetical protein RFI_05504 [Reticulomyxa filosa]|eukprot:ETO31619.1 hypothetical protein RFI_05504 [Reticulomyxa filosa]